MNRIGKGEFSGIGGWMGGRCFVFGLVYFVRFEFGLFFLKGF